MSTYQTTFVQYNEGEPIIFFVPIKFHVKQTSISHTNAFIFPSPTHRKGRPGEKPEHHFETAQEVKQLSFDANRGKQYPRLFIQSTRIRSEP